MEQAEEEMVREDTVRDNKHYWKTRRSLEKGLKEAYLLYFENFVVIALFKDLSESVIQEQRTWNKSLQLYQGCFWLNFIIISAVEQWSH